MFNDLIFSTIRKWTMSNVTKNNLVNIDVDNHIYRLDIMDKVEALLNQVSGLPPVKKQLAKYNFDKNAEFLVTINPSENKYSYWVQSEASGKMEKADLNEIMDCKEVNDYFASLV